MFTTDAFYLKNHTYKQCEDYALTNPFGEPLASAIADGCSASPYTDVGSKIILLELFNVMNDEGIIEFETTINETILWDLFSKCFYNSSNLINLYNLPYESLDCTIGLVTYNESEIIATLIGDGYIYTEFTNGSVSITKISFSENMPDYLTYFFSKDGTNHPYFSDPYNEKVLTDNFGNTKTLEKGIYYQTYNPEDVQKIIIASDGLEKVFNHDDTIYDDFKLLEKLSDFKQGSGNFVKRKLAKFTKRMEQNGIKMLDDLSMAALSK